MNTIQTIPGQIKSVILDSLLDTEPKTTGPRPVKGWLSTPHKDIGGEIVLPSAFEKTMDTFMTNPIMLYMHNMLQPIGTWDDYTLSPKGLFVKGQIVEGIPEADYIWTLVARKVLRTLSIGFARKQGEYDKKQAAFVISELDLYEGSIVSIPMNRNALITIDAEGKFVNIKAMDADLFPSVTAKSIISYTKYPTQEPNTPWDGEAARRELADWAEIEPSEDDGEDEGGNGESESEDPGGPKIDFSKYKLGFTYVVSGEEDKLGSYKLPHHTVVNDRLVTNLQGCRAAIGALAGARGGVDLPDAERRAAYTHLARHIKDDFKTTVPPYEQLSFMSDLEIRRMVGAWDKNAFGVHSGTNTTCSWTYTTTAPESERKEDTMTPEQEKTLADMTAALTALEAKVSALESESESLKAALADSKNEMTTLEACVKDIHDCTVAAIMSITDTSDEDAASESHPE